MRSVRRGRHARTLLTVLFVSGAMMACDNEPLQIVDTLGVEEAEALAEVLLDITLRGNAWVTDPQGGAAVGGPVGAPVMVDTSLEFQTECGLGGFVDVDASLTGTVDGEAGTGSLDLTAVQTHQNCLAVHFESGKEFRLDGAPNLAADYAVSWSGSGFDATGTYVGALDWTVDGRSGRCDVSVAFDAEGSLQEGASSASLSGTVCGSTVSHSVTR